MKVVKLSALGSNANSYTIPAQSDTWIYTYSSQYRDAGRARIKLDSSECRVPRTCEPQVRNPWLHVQGVFVMYHSVRSQWMREVQQVDSAPHLDPAPVPRGPHSAAAVTLARSSITADEWQMGGGGSSLRNAILVNMLVCTHHVSCWTLSLSGATVCLMGLPGQQVAPLQDSITLTS
jgi:hypothetical protein